MKKILFTASISITFFACANQSGNDKTTTATTPKSMLTIDGKALFQANCASCHQVLKSSVGPGLKGIRNSIPNRQWLYDWVHNPTKLIESGDKYANEIFAKWNKSPMTAFPNLSNEEIDAIIEYCEQ